MITRSPEAGQVSTWQRELARGYRDVASLLSAVGVDAAEARGAPLSERRFRTRVPRGYVARMRHGDAADPLLRQVLPVAAEDEVTSGYGIDPVGDLAARRPGGVLQKYRGRALLVTTGACAVHCRYCFRREFPYTQATAAADDWQQALAFLASDTTIDEVLLSGGDPLMLPDDRLASLVARLDDLPHIRRLRLHTRLPVVLPERVDDALVRWLAHTRLGRVVVLHVNHANEIDDAVAQAVQRLRSAGCHVLNQSVLLRGVNDDAAALAALSLRLFDAGILPGYLHQLDRVQGAAHFAVTDARALAIDRELRALLPGYLMPKLVYEESGAPSKRPLAERT